MSPCHNVIQFCIHDWYYTIAAFPVLAATPPVFDRLRVANMEGEGLGNLIVWLSTQLSYVVTPLLIMQPSDVQYVWDRSCILCLATKMGQVPAESYTECMKNIQAKSHDSKRLLSDKHENTQQWRNHLVEQKDGTIWSFTHITAVPQWLSFKLGYVLQVRLTSPLEVVLVL